MPPPLGPDPEITLPAVWKDELSNGLKIYGIEQAELPLVQFSLVLRGGQLLDDLEKPGVANLVGAMLMEGTRNKTPVELEEAIDDLGASIRVFSDRGSIRITANGLASKFDRIFSLVNEILLEPRWDEKEFERVKKQTIERINQSKAQPTGISQLVFSRLLFGDDHIYSRPVTGTAESVGALTLDDLKGTYEKYFSPSIAGITIAGDISRSEALAVFKILEETWAAKDVVFPEYPVPPSPEKPALYFVDTPGARQSVITIGGPALSAKDPDYYPATVMNYKLGGSFNGFVNLVLREEKGYTYGARTGFSGYEETGIFSASSQVQGTATRESVQIFRDLMLKYREGISEEDLAFTKSALIKANALGFETLGNLMSMLNNIALYEYPDDYVKRQEAFVKALTLDRHKELARRYIDPGRMIYVVVGDAATQMKPLADLGLGRPALVSLD